MRPHMQAGRLGHKGVIDMSGSLGGMWLRAVPLVWVSELALVVISRGVSSSELFAMKLGIY